MHLQKVLVDIDSKKEFTIFTNINNKLQKFEIFLHDDATVEDAIL